MSVLHSPLTFNDVSPYLASQVRGRTYSNTVTFTAQQGATFNKVEVYRFGGGPAGIVGSNGQIIANSDPYSITTVNGFTLPTPVDPYGSSFSSAATYTYGGPLTTWSMGIRVTDWPNTDGVPKSKYVYYTPRYQIRFTNTNTGQTFTDQWGGVISFYISL
jgi:hypothetical protein